MGATDGMAPSTNTALRRMLDTYVELNTDTIEELDEEPSALEFMRYVAANRPFVIRLGAKDWNASRRWTAEYLREVVGDSLVNVAITPNGRADAVVQMPDGTFAYAEPLEQEAPFSQVLDLIQQSEKGNVEGPVLYAQTQNDNLRNEYEILFRDVPTSIPFARIALQKEPDAINFWLGNSRSVTSLHRDNYENVYVQVRGRKHFTLLPPLSIPCVKERRLPVARYVSDGLSRFGVTKRPKLDDPIELRPVPTRDPDDLPSGEGDICTLSRPLQIMLDEGDMMYLPALWYHKVTQTCGTEGFCCSVNYW